MLTKRIYRMETPEGTGVFSGPAVYEYNDEGRDLLGDAHFSPFDNPCPWNDGIDHMNTEDVCGFESIEQLLDWFRHTELFEILDKHDIHVTLFEIQAERVKHGRNQVMFPRHLATLVEKSKPTDFARNLKILSKL